MRAGSAALLAVLFAAALLPACGSKGPLRREKEVPQPTLYDPVLLGNMPLSIESIVEVEASSGMPAVAFQLQPPDKQTPLLQKDLSSGRSWLLLRAPRWFSFVARDLLLGKTAFAGQKITLTYAQGVRGSGHVERQPSLVRFEGVVSHEDLLAQVQPGEDPRVPGRGLEKIDNPDLRILLGNGIDVLVGMADAVKGGDASLDTRAWIAVYDVKGESKDWHLKVRKAYNERSLAPTEGYTVIVRRWRPNARPKAAWYTMPLGLVVLAAQMSYDAKKEEFHWVWEGVWQAQMTTQPVGSTPMVTPIPVVSVQYKEYKPDPRSADAAGLWRTLLSPVALGADFGTELFDEGLPVDPFKREE